MRAQDTTFGGQQPGGVAHQFPGEAVLTAAVEAWREAASPLPHPQTTLDGALPAADVLGLAAGHMRERVAAEKPPR